MGGGHCYGDECPLLRRDTLRDNRDMANESPLRTRFGEVVEASIEELVGQCYNLYEAPPLGMLVRAGEAVYGIVRGIATTALDPTRRVIARGADLTTEAEIYAAHPQLEKLLRTDVTVAVVGHREKSGALHQYLPAQPPRIHTFLYSCTPDEVRSFFASDAQPWLDFVHLLVGEDGVTDDVLAASLRQASTAFDDQRAFLIDASRAVAVALAGDTSRVNAIVRRLPLGEKPI